MGPKKVVTPKKEILSAGSIGIPHTLLHSGIGDRDELSNLWISSTHHLPGVGKNPTEQPAANNVWLANSTSNDPNVSGLPAGFFTHIGFLRVPEYASIFETVEDPAPGPNTAHIEFNSVAVDPTNNIRSLSITTSVLTPISRCSVRLNSSDPLDDPLIDLGLLEHEFESFTMREAVRAVQRFLNSPAWENYIIGPSEALASVGLKNDSQLNAYVRQNAAPTLHPVSTAAISPYNVSWGVTNPDLKVKGVRVVDASVFPLIPSGHTQAPVYIIAEMASDLIKLA
ncbi:FAD-linked reductase [Pleurotus eryngii]|uniref:FAD-linked reductase n=1 Tax=Pleurotus eryngii TaxID=5323 RepID=A0A9P6A4M5_PLEER|nr:FAD-linked reductase [Pleurotus eryngii]